MIQLKNISFSAENEDGVKEILKDITMDIDSGFLAITGPNGGGKSTLAKIIAGIIKPTSGKILLDGEDISGLIRTPEASMMASKISAVPSVRAYLLDLQRNMAKSHNVIMDGRDIGTVVLPEAKVKIFLCLHYRNSLTVLSLQICLHNATVKLIWKFFAMP